MSDAGEPRLSFADRPELDFQPGRPLPLFARREGVEVVVVAVAEYRELMALQAHAKRQAITATVQRTKAPPAGLSTIEKDPEVTAFLRDRFRGRETIEAIRAACVTAFGSERAPSIGRIQTFRARWRQYR